MNSKAVYIYKKPGRKDFTGVALFVEQRNEGSLIYHDTCHGHELIGRMKEETDDGCIFEANEEDNVYPGEWQFKLLTIEAFRRKYYEIVVDGDIIAQTLHTTEDLWEWYRTKYEIYP
jgi:hypothetical protein